MTIPTDARTQSQTETPDDSAQQTPEQPQEFDYSALEARVSDKLSEVFDDGPAPDTEDPTPKAGADPDGADPADPDGEEDDDAPADPAEDDGGDDDAEVEETVEEAAADEEDPPSDAPTLPDSQRRSLKAYGWSDDEIDQNLKVLGDKFLDTAQKIHTNRNAELQQWADAGRKAREQQKQQPGDPNAQGDPQPEQGTLPTTLKPVDADALKKTYGEDELIDQIVAPVNATIKAINAILPQLEQGVQHSQQNEQQALVREIEGFFGDASLKPYKELYGDGSDGQPLNEEQWGRRNKVLETADALIAGAKFQGRNLSVREALELAHDTVSGDFREQAVRNDIKKVAKKRNRSITSRPSNRGRDGVQPSGSPRSREELETRTAQRLKKALG